jgi:hypothetical protein
VFSVLSGPAGIMGRAHGCFGRHPHPPAIVNINPYPNINDGHYRMLFAATCIEILEII